MSDKQSPEDKFSRLFAMMRDDGGTWDLSPNDKEAIRNGLDSVKALLEYIRATTGCYPLKIIRSIGFPEEELDQL